ncbi:MAG: T9SS type A sorting domain-containing protein [Cyclobacteriaceae bacterium]
MRWILFVLAAMLLPAASYAQDITAAEYFVDEDAGFGDNTAIPVPDTGADVILDFTVDLSTVTEGLHTLGVRVKDANGVWSIVTNRPFVVVKELTPPNLVAAEYFIDEDQGFGANTAIDISDTQSNDTLDFQADLSGLEPGVHTLYVRVKDAEGKWSLVTQRLFVVADDVVSNLVAFNYYYYDIAEETVVGEGMYTYDIPEPAPIVDTEFAATVDPLEDGKNYLIYVWVVDDEEVSSLIVTRQFRFTETIPIVVEPLEVTDVTCAGEEDGAVTITASGGVGELRYSISTDSANYTTSRTFEGLAPGTYTAYVRGNVDDYVESQEFTIEAPEALLLAEESKIDVVCSSDATGSITVVASGGAGAGYEYRLGDGEYQASATFSELTAGDYTVTVRDANGCTVSIEETINFQNEAPPAPTVRRSDESDQVTELSLIAENVAEGATLQWYRNGEAIDGASETTLPITEAGTYSLIASLGGCNSEEVIADEITNVSELIAENIIVYPVPSSQQIHLDIPSGLFNGSVTIDLLDMKGQSLRSWMFETGQPVQMTYDLSTLTKGTYIISIRSQGKVVNKRISKL